MNPSAVDLGTIKNPAIASSVIVSTSLMRRQSFEEK